MIADQGTMAEKRGGLSLLLRILAVGFAGVLLICALVELKKINAPGAPVIWVYITIAVAGLTLILQWPTVFHRLPRRGRIAASLMLAVTTLVWGFEMAAMEPAWIATPAGRAEAANSAKLQKEQQERDAAEARDRAEKDETARTLAKAEEAETKLAELKDKLEACFTSFGHRLPALEDPVKESLHNPSAFEHVETVVIEPDSDQNNVVMRFRAENGFGALRTAEVRAQLIADDCSVQNIGKPTID